MPALNAITGVILAGGKSSRMGTDKYALRYQHKSFLETIITTLGAAHINSIFTSGLDYFKKNIPDEMQAIGPVGGLYSSLKFLAKQTTGVIFIPVDMPLMTAPLLLQLIQTPFEGDALCYTTCHFPLLIKSSPAILTTLSKIIQESRSSLSIKNFLQSITLSKIPPPENDTSLFKNINTPADYKALIN